MDENLSAPQKSGFLKDYRFWVLLASIVVFTVLLAFDLNNATLPTPDDYGTASCVFAYIATALPFLIIFAVAAIKLKKSKKLLYTGLFLAVSYFARIIFINYISKDYEDYLSLWVAEYRTLSIKEGLVKQVGNYAPLYNYFLIALSRIDLKDMYLIKILSIYGEVITAVLAIKIVALARGEKFDFFWLGILLLMPVFIADSTQWGQCDTLYTMCAVAGVYCALKRRSVLCYICMGIGLAFKMQILLIFPAGLILLLAKNKEGEKYLLWRYIWIVPLVFVALSSFSVFCGGNVLKVFKVYLNQTVEGNGTGLNLHCANITMPLSSIPRGSVAYYILLVFFILVTAVVDTFLIVHCLRRSKGVFDIEQALFVCAIMPFASVYFMPKMLDRFMYLAEMFLFIYFAVKRDKNSFTASLILETGQWMLFAHTLFHLPATHIFSPILSTCALVLVAARYFTYYPVNKPKLTKLFAALEK